MLENIENIIKSKIDNNNYIKSLLDLSLKHNLISKEIYDNIYYNLYCLLKEVLKKYTGEVNLTISISESKLINESNLYMLGLYLKNKTINESLKELFNKNLLPLYNKSKEYLISLVNKTKFLYKTIFKSNMLNVNNYFYNITFNEGIKAFFNKYNTSYETDNHLINLDYNPYLKITNLYGIKYITKVLEYINYENIFCSKFKIDNLLKKYDNLPINIFEIVLKRVLCAEYLNKDFNSLALEKNDIPKLLNINENSLYKSFNNIKIKLNSPSKVNDYLDKCIDEIVKDLLHTKDKLLNIEK